MCQSIFGLAFKGDNPGFGSETCKGKLMWGILLTLTKFEILLLNKQWNILYKFGSD